MGTKAFFVAVLFLLTAVACQAAPAELPEVTFVGTEYAYEGPESIAGGWTRVNFDNQGELPHELMLIQLLEGKTLDDVPAILESEGAPPSWINLVGNVSAPAGGSGSFVSSLPAGEYAMLSFGGGEEGPPDVMQGMLAGLTVTEAEVEVPESALPEATASVSMVDFQFVVEGLKPGENVVRLSNDGTELHEAIMFRLKEGKMMEDFQAFMELEMPEGEPPMEDVGAVFLSPGNETYVTVNLEAGNHVLLCFIPSEANANAPHFMLGMVTEVEVN
jgi:hypothetical protein